MEAMDENMIDDDMDEDELYELEDDSEENDDDGEELDETVVKTTFFAHSDPVFAVALSPDGTLALTGGQDDKARLWRTESGDEVFSSSDFNDSVICTAFNHDGKLFAAADMEGSVKVWRITSGDPLKAELTWSESVDQVMWMDWHQRANVLLVGTQAGEVFMWKVPSGECKIVSSPGTGTEVGKFMPNGKTAIVGYQDGSIKLIDLNTCSALHTMKPPDVGSIVSLEESADGNIVAAGSLNGKLAFVSPHTGKVLNIAVCDPSGERSVEHVAFSHNPGSHPICVATTSTTISIYDYSKNTMRWQHTFAEGPKTGLTKLLWDQKLNNVAILGTYDGHLIMFDVRQIDCQKQIRVHRKAILNLQLSTNGQYLITSSDDRTAKILATELLTSKLTS